MDTINYATTETYDCFIVHHEEDASEARLIADQLADNGLSVWLAERCLIPGHQRVEAFQNGIRDSQSIAVLVGEKKFDAWQKELINAALNNALTSSRPVIPVLLDNGPTESDLPPFLAERVPVDLRQRKQGGSYLGLERLIRGIKDKRSGENSNRPEPSPAVNEHPSPKPELDPPALAQCLLSTVDHEDHHEPMGLDDLFDHAAKRQPTKQVETKRSLITTAVIACSRHYPELIAEHLFRRFVAHRERKLVDLNHFPIKLTLERRPWMSPDEFKRHLIDHFDSQHKTLDDVADDIVAHCQGQLALYIPIPVEHPWWELPWRINDASSVLLELSASLKGRHNVDCEPILVVIFSCVLDARSKHSAEQSCQARTWWISLLARWLPWWPSHFIGVQATRLLRPADFDNWPRKWLKDALEDDMWDLLHRFANSLKHDRDRQKQYPEKWDMGCRALLNQHLKEDLVEHFQSKRG